MIVWGGLYLIFAFGSVTSDFANRLFKVPAIFVFLPDHLVMPVSRIVMSVLFIGMGMVFIVRGVLLG